MVSKTRMKADAHHILLDRQPDVCSSVFYASMYPFRCTSDIAASVVVVVVCLFVF